jgi:tetratricopeptide (TPR) repeat protein
MLTKNLFPLAVLLSLTPVAFAVPDAGGGPPGPNRGAAPATPAPAPVRVDPTQAKKTFTLGFEEFQMATLLENGSVGKTGEDGLRAKDAVKTGMSRAREKFRFAVAQDPNMKEGWNMLGFTSRKLGDYEESLTAYEKALALAPDYPEAIEYRAELFLLTGRLSEVKDAYASLLKSSPSYAGVLKTSAQDWVKAKKTSPNVTEAQRAEFAAWVSKL